MKDEILQMLKSRKDFISGQELCEHFQVSRTAVWKVMKQLQNDGYEIEAINRKGYRLIASPDVLTVPEILSVMPTEVMGRKIYYYDCLGSTNDQARMLAEQGAEEGSLIIAETQNTGKGRMGRSFFSPEGCGIWMSLILKPEIPPMDASMVTLVGAMAVHEMMQDYGIAAGIKWPNDIVIDGRKVTGILTEMSAGPDRINYIVIGIGINANMKFFPGELEKTAISMSMVTGENYHRAEIIACVIDHFEKNYREFLKTGDLRFLKERYNASLIHRDKEIDVHEIRRVWRGISRGINNIGELIVSSNEGDVIVRSGEVSIRGVYGYMK